MDRVVKIGLLLAAMLLMQTAGANAAGDILIPRYTISEAPGKPLLIKEPKMPDLSGYTAEAVAAKIAYKPAGRALIQPMIKENALDEFIGGEDRFKEWVVRQKQMPVAIFIDRGACARGGWMRWPCAPQSSPWVWRCRIEENSSLKVS